MARIETKNGVWVDARACILGRLCSGDPGPGLGLVGAAARAARLDEKMRFFVAFLLRQFLLQNKGVVGQVVLGARRPAGPKRCVCVCVTFSHLCGVRRLLQTGGSGETRRNEVVRQSPRGSQAGFQGVGFYRFKDFGGVCQVFGLLDLQNQIRREKLCRSH